MGAEAGLEPATYKSAYKRETFVLNVEVRLTFLSPQAVCPVCREPLPEEIVNGVDAGEFQHSADSEEDQVKYVPSSEIIKMQQKMSELLQRQVEKGGVIDLEAERNKYLIPKVIVVPFCHSGSSVQIGLRR